MRSALSESFPRGKASKPSASATYTAWKRTDGTLSFDYSRNSVPVRVRVPSDSRLIWAQPLGKTLITIAGCYGITAEDALRASLIEEVRP